MEAAKKIFTRAHIIWFLLLNFGLVLLAAGIHFFKSPNNFAMGGTSGISIIAATLLPHMDVGTFMFIINGVLIVLGLVFLGRAVIGATLYSSVALSFYVWVLERAVPMARPFTDDTFLELCYAVILPAAGSAIIFNIGASSGGTDIIAMILSKYTSLEIGKALLVSDFCIALYNPSSKGRPDYLARAVRILLANGKAPGTVCGIVRNIGRTGQESSVLTLAALETTPVDMFTTVFVGNAQTRQLSGRMVTPRGYRA